TCYVILYATDQLRSTGSQQSAEQVIGNLSTTRRLSVRRAPRPRQNSSARERRLQTCNTESTTSCLTMRKSSFACSSSLLSSLRSTVSPWLDALPHVRPQQQHQYLMFANTLTLAPGI